jgi:hypothetical protein
MSKSTMDGPKLEANPRNGPPMPRMVRTAPNRETAQVGKVSSDLGLCVWSGRRESNSRNQFGRSPVVSVADRIACSGDSWSCPFVPVSALFGGGYWHGDGTRLGSRDGSRPVGSEQTTYALRDQLLHFGTWARVNLAAETSVNISHHSPAIC